MKWWLIDEETVEKIRAALEYAMENAGVFDDHTYRLNSEALHHLDTNLNSTTVVPDDFRESE